jgi:hypothetical protein
MRSLPAKVDEPMYQAVLEFAKEISDNPNMSKAVRILLATGLQHKKGLAKKFKKIGEASMAIEEQRDLGKIQRLLMSSGFSAWNLGQALEKIDRMPLPEEKKERLRDAARMFDKHKSDTGNKILEMYEVFYQEPEKPSFPEKFWKKRCQGCPYVGKLEFCLKNCRVDNGRFLQKWHKLQERNK